MGKPSADLAAIGRNYMRNSVVVLSAILAASSAGALTLSSAQAQDTVKIGLIMAYSGQFADTAAQMDNSI